MGKKHPSSKSSSRSSIHKGYFNDPLMCVIESEILGHASDQLTFFREKVRQSRLQTTDYWEVNVGRTNIWLPCTTEEAVEQMEDGCLVRLVSA